MREIGMAEERESIPSLAISSPDSLSLSFRIIVYKRQDGDRFGCDLRQSLVMPLDELLRHNRDSPQPPASRESGTRRSEDRPCRAVGVEAVGFPEGSAEPEATAPLFCRLGGFGG